MKIQEMNEFDNGIVAKTKNVIGGELRVSGRRIGVSLIIRCLREGMTLQDICGDYDIPIEKLKNILDEICKILETL